MWSVKFSGKQLKFFHQVVGPNARNLILAGVLPQNPLGKPTTLRTTVPITRILEPGKRGKRVKSKGKELNKR